MPEPIDKPKKRKSGARPQARKVRKDPLFESYNRWMGRILAPASKDERLAAIREAGEKKDETAVPALLHARFGTMCDQEEKKEAAEALGRMQSQIPFQSIVEVLAFYIEKSEKGEKASAMAQAYGAICRNPDKEEFMRLVPLFCQAIAEIRGVHVLSDRLIDIFKIEGIGSSDSLVHKIMTTGKSPQETRQELEMLKREFAMLRDDSQLMDELTKIVKVEQLREESEEARTAMRNGFSDLKSVYPDLSILDYQDAVATDTRTYLRLMLNPRLGCAIIASVCLREMAAANAPRREEISAAVKPLLAELEQENDRIREIIKAHLYEITGQKEPGGN